MKGETTAVQFRLEIRKPQKARRMVDLESTELPTIGEFLRVATLDEEGSERVLVTGKQEPAEDGKWIIWGESVGIEV